MNKYPKVLTRFTLLLCTLVVIPHLSMAIQEEAWNALFNNEVDTAYSLFQDSLSSQSNEEALQGWLLSAWTKGNAPEMAAALTRLIGEFPDSPYLPAYVSMMNGSELHGWKAQDRIQMFNTMTKPSSLFNRSQIALELTETLDKVLDDRTYQAAGQAGVLLDNWSVIGPFGQYGAADFFHPFGPEIHFKESYRGWQKDVQWNPIQPSDHAGILELDTLIQPNTGIAYAVHVMESDSSTNAWLSIQSPHNFQVWWNGNPILEKSNFLLHTSQEKSLKVPLQKGKNLLVIKSQKTGGSWWVRAFIQPQKEPFHLASVPFHPADFKTLFLQPFDRKRKKPEESAMSHSLYPYTLDSNKQPIKQALQSLLLSAWHRERGDYEYARHCIEEALIQFPNSALLQLIYGDLSFALTDVRPGSQSRFQQEAESAYRKALEWYPECKMALVGLITYYLDRDQVDQALDTINQHLRDHPDIKSDGQAQIIDYTYGILYNKKNFDEDAIRAFRRSMKSWLPSYELDIRLFDYYYRRNDIPHASAILEEALQDFPAYVPFLERATRSGLSKKLATQAVDLLKKARKIHPHRLQYAFLLGDAFERQGRIHDAFSLFSTLVKEYPKQVQIHERLAALHLMLSERDQALVSYKKAYHLDPRRMKPFRALRDLGNRVDFPYQKYDVQLDDVDISKASKWKTSRASGIYLLDIMVMQLHEDGTYDQYIHQAIQVLNQEGMRKWAETVIPRGGNVELIKARTITPDGTEWDVSHLQDLQGQQSLSMYGIAPGVILEYAYLERLGRSDPGVNYSGGGYFFGSDDDPMLLSQLTVVKPKNMILHWDQNPEDFNPTIEETDKAVIYTWKNEMADGLKPERFAPPLAERVPSVQWSTCPDWRTFVERQIMTLYGYEESSNEIDQLGKQLQSTSQSQEDYVEKVFGYVQSQIEETSGGETTLDTVMLGAGNKYQKLRLVRQLLRWANIQTHLAIAMDNDPHNGYRPLPVLNYPSSTVLVVPKQEGISERILLDFSSRFAQTGSIDPHLQKQVALFFDGDVPYFEPLLPSLWEHGLIDRTFHVSMQKDRSATIRGQYIYGNLFDRQIREALTNPEVKKRLVDSQLARDLRGIHVDQSGIEDVDDLQKLPRLVFQGSIPDVAQPAENHSVKIPPVLIRTQAAALVSEPTRQFPMEFQTSIVWDPLEIRLDMSTYLQQGAHIILPENTVLISEFGFYSLYFAWDGPEVVLRRSFLIPPQVIQPDAYPRFVNFCRQIDQAEDRTISIQNPPHM